MLSNQSSGLLGAAADPGLVSMLAGMEKDERQDYVARHSGDINVVIMGKIVSDIANKLEIAKKGAQPGTNSTVLAQTIAAIDPETQVQQQQAQQAMPQQAMPQPAMPQQAMPQQAMPQPAMPLQAPQQQGQTRRAADGGYMDSRLPEEMGIGALPERSLSNMAYGGIVGFNGAAESLVRSYTGGKDYFLDVPETVRDPSVPYYRMIPNPLASLAGRKFGSYAEAVQAYNNALYDPTKATRRDQYAPPSVATMPTDDTRRGGMANDPRIQGSAGAAPGAAPPADAAPRPAAVPAARPTAGAGAGATGIQALLTPPDLTPAAIAKARADFTREQPAVVDPLSEKRQALVNEKNKNAEAEYTGFKERMAKQGDPYAKQEERANKQEASIAESAERNPYLALMEAGFAMMAGDSPYAMVNLGKGALAGTKTYRDGLALIEKAKEKLTETRDRIDGLRLIRSDLNASEERDIQRETRRTALEGKTIMFNALEKLTGESKAQIESNVQLYLNAQEKGKDRGLQAGIAQLQERGAAGRNAAGLAMQEKIAKMPSKEAQTAMMLGTGDTEQARLESGLRKIQDLSADKSGAVYAKMYADHVAESKKAMVEPMSPTEYAASIRSFLSVFKPTVVDDTKSKVNQNVYPRPSP